MPDSKTALLAEVNSLDLTTSTLTDLRGLPRRIDNRVGHITRNGAGTPDEKRGLEEKRVCIVARIAELSAVVHVAASDSLEARLEKQEKLALRIAKLSRKAQKDRRQMDNAMASTVAAQLGVTDTDSESAQGLAAGVASGSADLPAVVEPGIVGMLCSATHGN